MDCQVYFNDPEESGSDAGNENLFEAEYEWIGEGGNRTRDANDTKDLIISGPSFLSIAARNSDASGELRQRVGRRKPETRRITRRPVVDGYWKWS